MLNILGARTTYSCSVLWDVQEASLTYGQLLSKIVAGKSELDGLVLDLKSSGLILWASVLLPPPS